MSKNNNVCKNLSFSDCELTILRMAVDNAEKKMGKRSVNSEDVQNIINIVLLYPYQFVKNGFFI